MVSTSFIEGFKFVQTSLLPSGQPEISVGWPLAVIQSPETAFDNQKKVTSYQTLYNLEINKIETKLENCKSDLKNSSLILFLKYKTI